jgi:hypothetical protein
MDPEWQKLCEHAMMADTDAARIDYAESLLATARIMANTACRHCGGYGHMEGGVPCPWCSPEALIQALSALVETFAHEDAEGVLDSLGFQSVADAMRLLSRANRLTLTKEHGNRVLAVWVV